MSSPKKDDFARWVGRWLPDDSARRLRPGEDHATTGAPKLASGGLVVLRVTRQAEGLPLSKQANSPKPLTCRFAPWQDSNLRLTD